MYHSNPLYTGNTDLSNCILGMRNLTADIHMHAKYGTIWKRISIKYRFLKFYLLVRTCWQLCKMSEICVVRREPGVNSTSLHAEIDQMVLKEAGK